MSLSGLSLLLLLGLIGIGLCIWRKPSESLRVFLHIVLWMLVRVKVRGAKLPASGPALVAANHYSFLDAFLMGSGTKRWIRYLLWKPYYENKTFQPFAKALYCLPMAQEGIREIIANLKGARAVIEQGEMVGIFPEGEITRTGAMAPFRRGYEKILQGTKAPIIPMHLSGLWKHPASPSPEPWLPWRRWDVTISIGEPMPSTTTPEELQQRVLELIGETVGERFLRVARREWNRPALADNSGKELTFGEWATAAVLLSKQLRDARRIAVLLPPGVDAAIANMAVFVAGKVVVNLPWTDRASAVQELMKQYGAGAVITSRNLSAELGELPGIKYIEDVLAQPGSMTARIAAFRARHTFEVPGDAGDEAAVILPAGPGAAFSNTVLSHCALLANVEGVGQAFLAAGEADKILSNYPLSHPLGLTVGLLFPMAMGLPCVLQPEPEDSIGQTGATIALLTAGVIRKCLQEGDGGTLMRLRHVVSSWEESGDDLAAEFTACSGRVLSFAYGGATYGLVVALFRPGGRLLQGVLAKVIHPETGESQPFGTAGTLLVKAPGCAQQDGYAPMSVMARLEEDGSLDLLDGRLPQERLSAGHSTRTLEAI